MALVESYWRKYGSRSSSRLIREIARKKDFVEDFGKSLGTSLGRSLGKNGCVTILGCGFWLIILVVLLIAVLAKAIAS